MPQKKCSAAVLSTSVFTNSPSADYYEPMRPRCFPAGVLRVLALCVIALLVSAPAVAEIAAAAQLGARYSELADSAQYRCLDDRPEQTVCRMMRVEHLAIEGQPLRGLELHYAKQKLAGICRVFDESTFAQVEASLARRHGAATDHSELLKAGMGGAFTNRIVAWTEGQVVTMLEQYHEHVTTSSVCEMDKVSFERLLSARAARRVRGVRDL